MNNDNANTDCPKRCWQMAAVAGILLALLLWLATSWSFFGSLIMGLLLFVIGGFLLNWLLCSASTASTAGHSAPEPAASAPAPEPAQPAAAAPAATATAAPAKAAEIKPTATLKGQEEVSAKKSDYKYEAPAKKAPAKKAAAKKAAPKAAAAKAPAKKAAPKAKPVAADGKPEMLKKARAGGADDLKQIKGVGPKMETLLNSMGIYHFDQVAGWRKKEVEWVDNNLEGFKGRVSRDEWVKQAKVLAKGGATEFSKKVEKGGVY